MKLAIAVATLCLGSLAPHGEAVKLRGGALELAVDRHLPLIEGGDTTDADELQRLMQIADIGPSSSIKDFTKQLGEIVSNLTAKVKQSHTDDKEAISKEKTKLFNGCLGEGSTGTVTSPKVTKAVTDYNYAKGNASTCDEGKFVLAEAERLCKEVVKSVKGTKTAVCKDVIAVKDPSIGHCNNAPTMKKRKDWLVAMKQHFDAKHVKLQGEVKTCNAAKQNFTSEDDSCKKKISAHDAKKKLCDSLGGANLETIKCKAVGAVGNMCVEYDSCYKAAVGAFHNFTNATAQRVISRKLQWRMLKRLECLVGAYDTKKGVDKDKLKDCAKKGAYDTTHLTMTYPAHSTKAPCKSALPAGIKDTCGKNLPTKAPPSQEQKDAQVADKAKKDMSPLQQAKAIPVFKDVETKSKSSTSGKTEVDKCTYQALKDYNVKGEAEGGTSDLKKCSVTGDLRENKEGSKTCFKECCKDPACVGLVFHPAATMLKKEWSGEVPRTGFTTYKLLKRKVD